MKRCDPEPCDPERWVSAEVWIPKAPVTRRRPVVGHMSGPCATVVVAKLVLVMRVWEPASFGLFGCVIFDYCHIPTSPLMPGNRWCPDIEGSDEKRKRPLVRTFGLLRRKH